MDCCKYEVRINNKTHDRNRVDKPWFDEECKCLKTVYRKSIYMFNKFKSDTYRQALRVAKSDSKRKGKKNKYFYKNVEGNKLSYLRKYNPKMCYRCFNKRKTHKDCVHINTKQLTDHFRTLFSQETDVGDSCNTGETTRPDAIFEELDCAISEAEAEVMKCIDLTLCF